MVVGNCRYAGGGWLGAPKANPEDGLLDVVIIEKLGLTDVLQLAPQSLARSDYLGKEGVFFARAKEILVETQPPGLEFTVDGEVIGDEPAEFSVIPQALKVIVGPAYVPEPADRIGQIKVLLFGAAADRAGTRETEFLVEISLEELWPLLAERHPDLSPMRDTLAFAVNGEYARGDAGVSAGDEVAVLPPVSGG